MARGILPLLVQRPTKSAVILKHTRTRNFKIYWNLATLVYGTMKELPHYLRLHSLLDFCIRSILINIH